MRALNYAARRTQEINRQLQQSKKANKEFKLLLLGTGESGKSTILKQMQIIYGEGFDTLSRQGYTALVYRNLLRSLKSIHNASEVLRVPISSDVVAAAAAKWAATSEEDVATFDDAVAAVFGAFWSDADVQAIYERRSEFSLADSTE